jgi:3-methyladenine DNA glycosylase AlkC
MASDESAFKNWINKNVLMDIANHVGRVDPQFDKKKFIAAAPKLETLELKPRVRLVRDQLRFLLPQEYPKALKILLASLKAGKMSGFTLWPYTEFIQAYGLDHPEISLKALREITKLFTGEFGVRPFIKNHTDLTMKFLLECSRDKDVHVRRWSSEGSRPRLPWGERLEDFVKNPQPTLEILEQLKHDEELYVRKSVANHLNDIAKDHPQFVIETLKRWLKTAGPEHHKKIDWIVKRALRTLIKDGHPAALALIGAKTDVKVKVQKFKMAKNRIAINSALAFEFQISSLSKKPQKMVIDYILHFKKSNNSTAPKVFKLKNIELAPGETVIVKKNHAVRKITTRRYYGGEQFIEIQINGKKYLKSAWHLTT